MQREARRDSLPVSMHVKLGRVVEDKTALNWGKSDVKRVAMASSQIPANHQTNFAGRSAIIWTPAGYNLKH